MIKTRAGGRAHTHTHARYGTTRLEDMLELITAKPDGGFVAVLHSCAVTKQGLHIFAAHHLPMAGEDPESIYKWQNFISARVQLMPPGRWGNQRSGLGALIGFKCIAGL